MAYDMELRELLLISCESGGLFTEHILGTYNGALGIVNCSCNHLLIVYTLSQSISAAFIISQSPCQCGPYVRIGNVSVLTNVQCA